jgi:hypothetical protein
LHVLQETLLAASQTGGADKELSKGFAPVFNIVTGNDNKIETPASPKKGVSFLGESGTLTDSTSSNGGSFDSSSTSNRGTSSETDFSRPLIKSDKQLMSSGAIVIKKLS